MPRRAPRPRQLELPVPPSWGGARPGAGRKRTARRPGPLHGPRPLHDPRCPVHVTLRAAPDVPSLRGRRLFAPLAVALGWATRASFRVLHFSVQVDHLHLIVEADSSRALRRGLHGVATRCAKTINRVCDRRGPVWTHRYHARDLRSPSEVRRAIAYVLLNFCKHLRADPGVDPRSSGPWFDGWLQPSVSSSRPRVVAAPRTWLASVGWRRAGGPIDPSQAPHRS
jgi:putative transposase